MYQILNLFLAFALIQMTVKANVHTWSDTAMETENLC